MAALKQRQIERAKQRQIEGKLLIVLFSFDDVNVLERDEEERRKDQDQKRKAEEVSLKKTHICSDQIFKEERRNRMEAEKNRRAEEKVRRQQQAGSFAGFGDKGDGRNFTISATGQKEKTEKEKKSTGLSKEQKEEAKVYLLYLIALLIAI